MHYLTLVHCNAHIRAKIISISLALSQKKMKLKSGYLELRFSVCCKTGEGGGATFWSVKYIKFTCWLKQKGTLLLLVHTLLLTHLCLVLLYDKIVRILSSPALFSERKKRLIILHCVFDFCLWYLCVDICGRTVKLSFLSCGFKGVRQTTAGITHCWGVVRAAVTYVMNGRQ